MAAVAEANGRSMNAEIITRLRNSIVHDRPDLMATVKEFIEGDEDSNDPYPEMVQAMFKALTEDRRRLIIAMMETMIAVDAPGDDVATTATPLMNAFKPKSKKKQSKKKIAKG